MSGRCDTAPVAEVGHHFVDHATPSSVLAAAEHGETHPHIPVYIGYEDYIAKGGYKLIERVRSGAVAIEPLLHELDASISPARRASL